LSKLWADTVAAAAVKIVLHIIISHHAKAR
jgi:hypothetical protein